jgi:hypothetical protein
MSVAVSGQRDVVAFAGKRGARNVPDTAEQ